MTMRKVISLQNTIVKHLVKLRLNHDYRYEQHRVVVEGIKPVKEICQTHLIKTLAVIDEALIPKGCKIDDIIVVNDIVMQKLSGMKNPEGILAEIEMPSLANFKGIKRMIALDKINDPGNLGTLLRTALALGWQGAFILDNSCDPYNEKSLRAARGATFRLALGSGSWAQLKKVAKENFLMPLVADLHGENLGKFHPEEGILLVLSNEARGISEEAAAFCHKITIPMPGEMESLNVAVAGGIMMYALTIKPGVGIQE